MLYLVGFSIKTGLYLVLKSPGYCWPLAIQQRDAQLTPTSIFLLPSVVAQRAESNLSGLKLKCMGQAILSLPLIYG